MVSFVVVVVCCWLFGCDPDNLVLLSGLIVSAALCVRDDASTPSAILTYNGDTLQLSRSSCREYGSSHSHTKCEHLILQ